MPSRHQSVVSVQVVRSERWARLLVNGRPAVRTRSPAPRSEGVSTPTFAPARGPSAPVHEADRKQRFTRAGRRPSDTHSKSGDLLGAHVSQRAGCAGHLTACPTVRITKTSGAVSVPDAVREYRRRPDASWRLACSAKRWGSSTHSLGGLRAGSEAEGSVTSMPKAGTAPGTHRSAPGGGAELANDTISARLGIVKPITCMSTDQRVRLAVRSGRSAPVSTVPR